MLKSIQIIFLSSLFITNIAFSQNHNGPVKWYTIEEAYEAYKTNPKPMFIDVYTDWCGWCKRMDATTFQDPNIAQYLNNNFYPVKLDAETRETIDFNGKTYENSQHNYGTALKDSLSSLNKTKQDSLSTFLAKKDSSNAERVQNDIKVNQQKLKKLNRQLRRTSHDFARDLLRGQMSYPTCIFLFDSLKSNMPAKGFLQAEKLAPLMTFVAEGVYKTTRNVQEYQQLWGKAMTNPTQNVKWMTFAQAQEAQKTNGKKLLIQIHHPQINSSRVMVSGTYESNAISQYVNENFNPVLLSINDTNTYIFQNQKYENVNGTNQLALALMENNPQFPFLAVVDDQGNLIMKIPQFFVASEFSPVLEYIATSAYKNQPYGEWLKTRK